MAPLVWVREYPAMPMYPLAGWPMIGVAARRVERP